MYLFDQLIAEQIGLSNLRHQTGRVLIVVIFGSLIILSIRRSKHLLSKHVGVHLVTVFQFFMLLAVSIVMIFSARYSAKGEGHNQAVALSAIVHEM